MASGCSAVNDHQSIGATRASLEDSEDWHIPRIPGIPIASSDLLGGHDG